MEKKMNHSSNKYLLNTYHVQDPVLVFVGNTKTWIEQKEEANQSQSSRDRKGCWSPSFRVQQGWRDE